MDLSILNAWWKGKTYIEEDKHITEYKSKKYKWSPKVLPEINLRPNNTYTLRGPRQIGKTTLVKLLIKRLLEIGTAEKSIFYWSCDQIADDAGLLSLLREYLEFADINNMKEKHIFLDEISSVKNWQKAVKFMWDSGQLKNCCLLLTGSHTLDIKHGLERLPGRVGKEGRDFVLLPMTFREFANLIRPDLNLKKTDVTDIVSVQKQAYKLKVYEKELKVLFEQYLITGGFPLAINEFFANNKIPEYVERLYLGWVSGDIVKWGKQEKILMQIIRAAITKQSTPISWDSLAKEAEVKSHKTISAYAEDLENMFVFNILYFLDINKKTADFNKNKKIYFLDPFIFHIFNNSLFIKSFEKNPALIEAVVASHLKRIAKAYFWKNKREVDVVLQNKNGFFAFEVKYQNKIKKEDYAGLFHFKRGILVTKDHFEKRGNYVSVPTHLFLAMI